MAPGRRVAPLFSQHHIYPEYTPMRPLTS